MADHRLETNWLGLFWYSLELRMVFTFLKDWVKNKEGGSSGGGGKEKNTQQRPYVAHKA